MGDMNSGKDVSLSSVKWGPNKPEVFDGKRDFLAVSTWLYKMEQYLHLMEVFAKGVTMTEENRVVYASTFLSGNAAIWWYTQVKANCAPSTWDTFKAALRKEFIPEDHVRRARDKFRRLRQLSSVAQYLAEFRNLCLVIPDFHQSEKLDKFISGLKYSVRVEVLKSNLETFEDAAKVALRVDSVLWNSGHRRTSSVRSTPETGPTPMEIGNVQKSPHTETQRDKDLRLNACFTCHVVGCRPWKHGGKRINNVGIQESEGSEGSVDEPEN